MADYDFTGAPWKGPCADDPIKWDIDAGSYAQWLAALRVCQEQCPLLRRCQQARQEFWPLADPRRPAYNPRSVIWAGVAYSETGRVLSVESLQRLATLRENRNEGLTRAGGSAGRAERSIAC